MNARIIDATGVAYFIARDAAIGALLAAMRSVDAIGDRAHREAADALCSLLDDIREQDERTCQHTGVATYRNG